MSDEVDEMVQDGWLSTGAAKAVRAHMLIHNIPADLATTELGLWQLGGSKTFETWLLTKAKKLGRTGLLLEILQYLKEDNGQNLDKYCERLKVARELEERYLGEDSWIGSINDDTPDEVVFKTLENDQ